jgi:hypothetical protein
VAGLVGRSTAEMERRGGRTDSPECRLENDDAVRRSRPSGKLRVAEQSAAERAHPHVEVVCRGPRVGAAGGLRLDRVIRTERRNRGLPAGDAIGGISVWIDRGKEKLDPGIRGQRQEYRRRIADVRIGAAEVTIENVDLAGDLRVRDILRRRVPNHMHDDRNAGDTGPCRRCPAQEHAGMVFDVVPGACVSRILRQQPAVHIHRPAIARLRRVTFAVSAASTGSAVPAVPAVAATAAVHRTTGHAVVRVLVAHSHAASGHASFLFVIIGMHGSRRHVVAVILAAWHPVERISFARHPVGRVRHTPAAFAFILASTA